MTAGIAAITFSCHNSTKVAEFWARAVGRNVVATASSGSAAILAPSPVTKWHSTKSITSPDIEGNQFDLIAE
jgi:hypothetical protein